MMPKLTKYRILLIEDDSVAAELVERQLDTPEARAHCAEFDITWVKYLRDGTDALQNNEFDAVLLDLRLPDCTGLEGIEQLLSCDPDASIVILTSMEEPEVAVEAAERGAHSFLNKRSLSSELLIRTILYASQRRQLRRTKRQLDEKSKEMEAAATVQRLLLPQSPPSIAGLDIASEYWPFEQVGGDYFDYFDMNGDLGLVIADASGRGLGPALIMAGLRRIVRSCVGMDHDIGRTLSIASDAIWEDTHEERFATAFLGRLHVDYADDGTLSTATLTYVSAGHPGYVLSPSGEVTRLNEGGIPLGLTSGFTYQVAPPVQLTPGDLLVLMTDGFIEVRNRKGQMWGARAVLDHIHTRRHLPAEAIIRSCRAAALEYCHPNTADDDMAMIIVKIGDNHSGTAES